jgi:hypothetical protein
LLWIVVALGTVKGALSGELFSAPCLKDMETKKELEKDAGRVV